MWPPDFLVPLLLSNNDGARPSKTISILHSRATPGALNECASPKVVEVWPGSFLSGHAGRYRQ
jgi:hypothetical protein